MGSRPATTGRDRAHQHGAGAAVEGQNREGARRRLTPTVPAAQEPAIRLVALAKSYGRNPVLKGLNVTVGAGELFEVTGPSGSGKTTLLRLVHGQLRPTAGELWVRGKGLHRRWRRGLGGLRRDVAFVFQEQRLLPRLTAFENVVYALQLRDPQVPNRDIMRRAAEALESVKLGHRRGAYPHQLSAGERQRIAVARALATRPRVLLADEPLAGMDEENAAVITRLIEEAAAAGTTVIVASHRHTFAATRVLRLPQERVMTNGVKKSSVKLLNAHVLARRDGHANGNGHTNGNGHANGNGHGSGHANGSGHGLSVSAATTDPSLAWWRLVLPARPRAPRPAKATRLPMWRRGAALTANAWRLVVINGLRSWSRDVRVAAPVMGTIALLLMLCGTLSLLGLALEGAIAGQAGQASLVRVYLADGASQQQIDSLEARLKADPRVASVTYISAAQALAEASKRPGLDSLANMSSSNPFPASLDVQARMVTQVSGIAASVKGDPAVDADYPTSYDPDTYSRLRHFALVAAAVAGGIVLMFTGIAYAVVANSMRSVAIARRQELAVGRLLGARGWMLRGPFVVEGLTTGALAGAVAAAAVGGAYLLGARFEGALYVQVLPGVGTTSVQYVLAAVLTAGIVLGAMTAMLGFRKARA